MHIYKRPNSTSSRGMALVMALIFLLVLTVLGLGAMQNTLLQERMAGNYAETNQALQMAELAARTAERNFRAAKCAGLDFPFVALNARPDSCPATRACGGSSVVASAQCMDDLPWNTAHDTNSGTARYVALELPPDCGLKEGETEDPNQDPDRLPEYSSSRDMILVLARGNGPAGAGQVVLQTLYFGGAMDGIAASTDGGGGSGGC
jgi:Tfp pilus assembly protein PilX